MDVARPTRVNDRELAERLRSAGLRATQPRVAVLRLLMELGGHRAAEELMEELRARGVPLPRGTVYNVLACLVGHGLLMVADVGPGRAVYEAASRWHHHFVCRACGAVQDVPCLSGKKPCLRPDRVEGSVDEAQVIFRGICRACSEATRSP